MVSRTNLLGRIFASLLLACFFRHVSATGDEDTLELLQVLVRHGNRTSQSVFTQFVPEYIETFSPFEFGLLTPQGRRQIFNSGQFLRQRYDDFLPEEYSYKSVSVKCTEVIRTMESAIVGMAAMFPPKKRQQWQDSGLGTQWTPIPCQYVPQTQDVVFEPVAGDCPRYHQLRVELQNSAEYVARLNELTRNGSVTEYIQQSLNMSTSEPLSERNLENVWENLHLLAEWGLPLPEWSKAVYPSPLTEINHLSFLKDYRTPELIMFSIGEYLRGVTTIAASLQDRQLRPLSRKLFISFAHDTTIMPLLVALNLESNPLQPDVGAMFIMEMHRIRETDEIGFKFVYRNVSWQDPTVYRMPGCQEICPLSFVMKTVEQYIATPSFQDRCSLGQD